MNNSTSVKVANNTISRYRRTCTHFKTIMYVFMSSLHFKDLFEMSMFSWYVSSRILALPSSERVKPSRLFSDVSEADRLKFAYLSVGLGVSDPVDQTLSCFVFFLHHLSHETNCNKKMVVWVI